MDLNELKLLSELNPENINKAYKTNIIFKFMNIKAEQPNLTQEQICKKLGISSSTIKRIRQDLNIKSPYRYDVPLKHSSTTPKKQATVPSSNSKDTKKSKPDKKKIKEKTGYGNAFNLDEEIDKA